MDNNKIMKWINGNCRNLVIWCWLSAIFSGNLLADGKQIAKISSFKGEVIIKSGPKVFQLQRKNQALFVGDRVQTKQGQARITFNDGAQMEVWPYSSSMLQERSEKRVDKGTKLTRRVTCFVGKMWFKSGNSKIKNYMQTPSMVCGLRGTELYVGTVLKRKRIGSVKNFSGVVIIHSGQKIFRVKHNGNVLFAGDHIQTKQGTVQIIFSDGATLKVKPFTSITIQEQKDKQQKITRRVSCFVGKLWYKSGRSQSKTYLQSPTVVCGLRGTEVAFGSVINRRRIGTVKDFKGTVIVRSQSKVFKLKRIRQVLYAGDRVQTKQGTAHIDFGDGAVMKIRPFTAVTIQERKEQAKTMTRRVTCLVGKLWFKSGSDSKTKNYLQTPTVVCGLRGTEVNFGMTLRRKRIGKIKQFHGSVSIRSETFVDLRQGTLSKITGEISRKPVPEPTAADTANCVSYALIETAQAMYARAAISGAPQQLAAAEQITRQGWQQAFAEMQNNPQAEVRERALTTIAGAPDRTFVDLQQGDLAEVAGEIIRETVPEPTADNAGNCLTFNIIAGAERAYNKITRTGSADVQSIMSLVENVIKISAAESAENPDPEVRALAVRTIANKVVIERDKNIIDIIEGEVDVEGAHEYGPVPPSNPSNAANSPSYISTERAYAAHILAEKTGDPADKAEAEIAEQEANRACASELAENPDKLVAAEAAVAFATGGETFTKAEVEEPVFIAEEAAMEEEATEEETTGDVRGGLPESIEQLQEMQKQIEQQQRASDQHQQQADRQEPVSNPDE